MPSSAPATVVCMNCRASYPEGQVHNCPQGDPSLIQRGGLVGVTIDDRYLIEAALTSGGMGIIYKARHVVLGKPLAIKILREAKDDAARKRFLQEAKSASMINHSNIVDINDFGVLPSGLPYLVMEYLEGQTLGDAIRQGPLVPKRACRIAAQIARGLQAVHDKGIVHRDLKPDNVFLLNREGQQDVVKIVDFGIAKIHSGPRLTQTGMTLGTPEYMAPEQATGAESDHRVDQYALGCILYEMLTGVLPFDSQDPMQLLLKHIGEPTTPPRQRKPDLRISDSLEGVVLRAMAKNRAERFRDMREMEQALLQETDPSTAQRVVPRTALASTVQMQSPVTPRPGPRPAAHKPRWRWALAVGLIGGVAGAMIWTLVMNRHPPGPVVDGAPKDPAGQVVPVKDRDPAAKDPAQQLTPDPPQRVTAEPAHADDPPAPVDQKSRRHKGRHAIAGPPLPVRFEIKNKHLDVTVACAASKKQTCLGSCAIEVPAVKGDCEISAPGHHGQTISYGDLQRRAQGKKVALSIELTPLFMGK